MKNENDFDQQKEKPWWKDPANRKEILVIDF